MRAKEKEGRERSQAAAAPASGAEDKQTPREGQTNPQPSDRSTGALPSISGSSLPYGQWPGPPGMYDGRGNGGRGSERGRGYDRGGRGYDRGRGYDSGRGDGGRGVRGRRGRVSPHLLLSTASLASSLPCFLAVLALYRGT